MPVQSTAELATLIHAELQRLGRNVPPPNLAIWEPDRKEWVLDCFAEYAALSRHTLPSAVYLDEGVYEGVFDPLHALNILKGIVTPEHGESVPVWTDLRPAKVE